MSKHSVLTVLALAGSACGAMAQDSTGTAPGLPGDAIDAFDGGEQIVSYVADLSSFETSWGTTFGVVPLVKTPKTSTEFFNNLTSSNGISDDLLKDVAPFSPMYTVWENAPGTGVNPDENILGTMMPAPPVLMSQFAVGISSFGTANGFSSDNISSAIVNYDPQNPNRLYVTRIESAGTVDAAQTGSTGSLAFGSIDADGNAYYRGDDFNSGGSVPAQVGGTSLYRTRVQDRTGVVNLIDTSGGADATDRLLAGQSTPHPAPSSHRGRPLSPESAPRLRLGRPSRPGRRRQTPPSIRPTSW